MNRFRKTLVETSIAKAADASFSKIINTASVELIESGTSKKSGSISFKYRVPANLCVATTRDPTLSCSAALALFDELSTYCFMMTDRTCRPGVSVHLNTEVLRPVEPGEVITITTSADKIGKTLGFCNMNTFNARGELVLRGKHIKYLPMGPVWDFMFHPRIAPVTGHVTDFVMNRMAHTYIGKKLSAVIMGGRNRSIQSPEPLVEELGGAFEMLSLKPVEEDVPGKTHDEYRYAVTVKPLLNNLIGRFHGGAIAMSIEQSLHLSSKHSDGKGSIRSMDINYLSGLKGDLTVVCRDDEASQFQPMLARSVGYIHDKKGEKGVEFSCLWRH